ncbi:mutator type transposase [Tanacetum coccineum]
MGKKHGINDAIKVTLFDVIIEVRPIGRDGAKQKGSSSASHLESSAAPNPNLVDVLLTTQESLFSLKVNYAGFFTKSPGRSYVNGDFSFFDCIDINEFSVHELNDMVKKIGNDEDVLDRMSENDANVIGEISYRHEDGESSQPNTTNPTTQTDFANDFYSASDTFLGEDDFDHFFGLDSEPVDATNAKNECVDKGKRVALDDDQIHVQGDNTMENETYDGNSDGDSSERSEHDKLVDTNNKLVEVEVDIAHFDRTNAKKIGNEGKPKFNTDEEFDIGMDVIDPKEFESASDEDGIERIKSRKLKHLKRQNKVKEGGVHKVNFFVGQEFPNSTIVKDLVHRHSIETKREIYLKKNDKVRVRAACRGTIHVFTTSCDIRPSQVVESSQTQGGESSQPTKWTKVKIANSKGVESPLKSPKRWWKSYYEKSGRQSMSLGSTSIQITRLRDLAVFNSQLVDVRDRLIINTLEYAREYLMKRIVLVKQVIDRSDGLLTPTDTRLFNVVKAKASECIANFNGGNLYWVTGPWGEVYVVGVQNKIYSCRKWEIIGMSYKHAVASNWNMASNNMDMGFPERWVHPCYRLDTWKQSSSAEDTSKYTILANEFET